MMRFEKQPIQFSPISLGIESNQNIVLIHQNHRRIPITPFQAQYLNLLMKGKTISEVVLSFLSEGWLIRFGELYELLQRLAKENSIISPKWSHLSGEGEFQFKTSSEIHYRNEDVLGLLKKAPFFSSLSEDLLKLFARHGQIYDTPAYVQLCTQGQKTRDLFLLVSGEAGVFRQDQGSRKLVVKLKAPTVFGEGGFFLEQPRATDVITTAPAKVIRIVFHEKFSQVMNQEKARSLQQRFWLLHALSNSEIFKNHPAEVFNEIGSLAKIHQLPIHNYLFHENDLGSSFFILIQGRLQVIRNQVCINKLEQGSCLGEVALFVNRGLRSASVLAETDCLIAEITQNKFYYFLAENLELAKKIEQQALILLNRDQKR
ncbi:MAG: cyclic nucleotide-binding domain-containing protein [Bdellovibrionales bacterium]|nr:cyclic nucleotide-binding domain-containing protein [Bdellovibrionales bacterium]